MPAVYRFKPLRRFLPTLLLLILLAAAPLHAAVFTVTTAADDGAGSLRHAIEAATTSPEADTIDFAPGLQSATLNLLSELPALPGDLTIDGSGSPVIDGSSVTGSPRYNWQSQYVAFYLKNKSNVTLSGLRITGFRFGIDLWDSASNVTVEGCSITADFGTDWYGTAVIFHPQANLESENVAFVNNTIHDGNFGVHSLGPSTVRNVTISGNTVYVTSIDINLANAGQNGATVENVTIADNTVFNDGIQLIANHEGTNSSSNCVIDGVTVSGNVLHDDNVQVDIDSGTQNRIVNLAIVDNRVSHPDGEGISLTNRADRDTNRIQAVLRRNVVTGCGSEGIQVEGGVEAEVTNNFVAGNRDGLAFYDGCTVLAANNLVTKNSQNGVRLNFVFGYPSENIQLVNNQIVDNCLFGISLDGPLIDPDSPIVRFIQENFTPVLAFNNVWQNSTNYSWVFPGASDLSVDPKFVDAASGDYRLSAGSPAIDAGHPDPAFNDTWVGQGGVRADIGLYGGPQAAWFDAALPPAVFPQGIQDVWVQSFSLSQKLAANDRFGAPILYNGAVAAAPCTTAWVKAYLPSAPTVGVSLTDDGLDGDMVAGDGEYEGTFTRSYYAETGTWTFEIQVVDGPIQQATLVVSNALQLDPPTGLMPNLLPENPIINLTPPLTWKAVTGADKYTVLILDRPFAQFKLDGLVYMDEGSDLTQTVPDGLLEPGRTYYWLVIATIDEADVNSMEEASFTTPKWVVARFDAQPASGGAPLTVAFTDTSQGNVATWSWDFGDGGSSTDQNPTHTFTNPGQYTVTLTVTGDNDTDFVTRTIDVHPISAALTDPPPALTNRTAYSLYVEGPDVAAYRYRLDGGEWSAVQSVSMPILFTLDADGPHTLDLLGRDAAGTEQDVPTEVSWTLDTQPPSAAFTTPSDGYTGAGPDTLEATAADANGIATVDFQVTDGLWFVGADNELQAAPVWLAGSDLDGGAWGIGASRFPWTPGKNYTLRLRATDNAGNQTIAAVYIACIDTVNNPAWTGMTLALSTQAIAAGETIGAAGRLSVLPVGGGSPAGRDVQLVVTAPDQSTEIVDSATTDGEGNFTFSNPGAFSQPGIYSLKAVFAGIADQLYASESEPRRLLVGSHPGYAIVVQGKITAGEGLEAHHKSVRRIYQRLLERGLTDGDIYYFNYAYDAQAEPLVIDAAPDKARVRAAVETWAANKLNAIAGPLYVVLVDHGNRDAFYLGDQTITPADLAAWLGTLEGRLGAEAKKESRAVVIGACYSGSFVPALSRAGRVVVTSAAADEESFKGPLEPDDIRAGEFFMQEFFHDLGLGRSFRTAFVRAAAQTEAYTRKGPSAAAFNRFFDDAVQHPLLDDDGDGRGSNALSAGTGDGLVADDLYLGVGASLANDPVDLTAVTDALYLDAATSAATLWAGTDENGEAWVEVRRPPLVLDNAGGSEQLVVPTEGHEMTVYNAGDGRYETAGVDFAEAGRYEIFYFRTAGDPGSNRLSSLQRSLVYKNKSGNQAPGAFDLTSPADQSSPKSMLVFDWEEAVDPDAGDTLTYTLIVAADVAFTDVVLTRRDIPRSLVLVDLSAGLEDATRYYWKVEAVDPFGARTASAQVWSFTTDNTNAFPGYVTGTVFNALNAAPLAGARVTASLGSAAFTSAENGFFLMLVPAGIATVSSTLEGFETTALAGLRIPEAGVLEVDLAMLPTGSALDSAAPVSSASVPPGAYETGLTVVLTCVDPGGSGCSGIYYTTDGSEPTSGAAVYAGPLTICQNTTLKFYAKDRAGNDEAVHTLIYSLNAGQGLGSVDGDCIVNLADAVTALQVLAGLTPAAPVALSSDVDGDTRIGLQELIYILQQTAELRVAVP